MKILRLAAIAGGVLAALLVALAFNAGFQTRVIQSGLAERPSLGISIGRIDVGLGHVRVDNLRIERRGAVLTLPSLDVDIPVLSSAWNHRLQVRGATALGWTLDASGVALSPAGKALLREPFVNSEVETLGAALALHGRRPGAIHGIDLSGFSGWGPFELQGSVILPPGSGSVPGPGPVLVDLKGSPTTTGAAYSVDLDSGGHRFAMLRAHWTDATQTLSGRWKADLEVAGRRPLSTEGEGSFETTSSGLHVEGRLEAGATGLAKAFLRRDPAGALKLSAEFDMVGQGPAWRVDRLELELGNGDPVLQVAALQAFGFNMATREVKLADPSRNLARVSVRNLPIGWIAPLLGPVGLSGSGLSCDLIAIPKGGGLEFRSQSPLSVTGLSVTGYGRSLAHGLDVSADVSVEVRPGGWEVELAPMRADAGSSRVFTLNVKLGRLSGRPQPLKLAGRLTADLPALLAQSAPIRAVRLGSGAVDCAFTGTVGQDGPVAAEIEARVSVSGLATGNAVLPALAAEIRADFDPEGRVVFNAPIRIDAGERISDLTLSGAMGRSRTGIAVDLQAASARLFVRDAKVLAAPFALGGAGRMRPFWNGISGQLAFAVKKAFWPGDFWLGDLDGSLLFQPGAIQCKGVHATLDGGSVSVDGILAPGPAPAGHPGFTADVTLEGFDFAPYFHALDPDRRPTLEGRFDVTGRLTGTAGDLMHLPGRFLGEWHLTSKGGVFRPLSEAVEAKSPAPDKMAAIGQFIGNVADTVTFRKEARNPDKRARSIAEFSDAATGIRYDRLDLSLERDESLNISIGSFSLISPEVRLDGSGAILAVPGTALLAEPLALELKLAARGHTADLLRTGGLLAPSKDDLGYADCTLPFDIGGTLSQPDMDDFRTTLQKLMP